MSSQRWRCRIISFLVSSTESKNKSIYALVQQHKLKCRCTRLSCLLITYLGSSNKVKFGTSRDPHFELGDRNKGTVNRLFAVAVVCLLIVFDFPAASKKREKLKTPVSGWTNPPSSLISHLLKPPQTLFSYQRDLNHGVR